MSRHNADVELELGLTKNSYDNVLQGIKDIQNKLKANGIKLNVEIDTGKLKKQLEKTDLGKEITVDGIKENLSKGLIEEFGVLNKTVQKQIKELANSMVDLGVTRKDDNTMFQQLEELGQLVIDNANIIERRTGVYDEFYNTLKKLSAIKISDSIKSDLGDDWNSLRMLYPNKFSTTSGIEMDSIYQEWSEQFKGIFTGTANPAEQFREVCNAIVQYRNDVDKIIPITSDTLMQSSVYEQIITEMGKVKNAVLLENDMNTSESALELQKEVGAFENVESSASAAASSKEKFADANKEVADSADRTVDSVNREQDAMMDMNDIDSILNNINTSGQTCTTVFQRFGTTLREAFSYYTLANLLQDAIRKVGDTAGEAIEKVAELNQLQTNLRMATGDGKDATNSLLSNYNEMGQELGFLASSVSNAADAYLRQGHSIADTNELIADSLILSKVSELETANSTKFLTAIMQAYKLEAKDMLDVVSSLSNVDLNAAVDAGGIAEAMSKTAVSAQLAGVSMHELISIVTTVGEVSQAGMSEVGNAIRTIFSRMKDVRDGNLSRIGDDGVIEDLSNIEGTLDAVGIKLRESNNEFRNMFTVLDETATKWSDMSSVQKAAVSEAYSGIRQSEKFNILMENWDKVRKYIEVSENSAGVASEKFDVYLESIESKTNSLKASLEKLASVTISEDLYKNLLSAAKAMVDLTADTGILKGALAGLATSGAIYAFGQLTTHLRNAAQGFSNLSEAMNITRSGNVTADNMQRLVDLTNGLSQSQTRLLLSTDNLTDAQKIAILTNQNLAQGMTDDVARATAEATLQTWGLVGAEEGAINASITLSGALKGMAATLLANPLVLVTAAVTLGVSAWTAYSQAQEEARQKALETAQASKEEADNLEELYIKYKQLQSIQNRTESQESEYKSIVEDVTKALGEKADVLKDLKEGTDEYTESLKKASQEELKDAWGDAKAGAKAAEEEALDKAGFNGINPLVTVVQGVTGNVFSYADLTSEAANIVTDNIYSKYPGGLNRYLNNNIDDLVDYYLLIKKSKEEIEQLDDESQLDTGFYKSLSKVYSELSESVETYIDSKYKALKLEYEAKNGIPTTIEEYEKLESFILFSVSGNIHDTFADMLSQDFAELKDTSEVEDSVQTVTQNLKELESILDRLGERTDENPYGNLSEDNPLIPEIERLSNLLKEEGGVFEAADGSKDLTSSLLEATIQAAAFIDQNMELENSLSSLQSEYDSVSKALSQYAEDGYLSANSLDALLSLSDQTLNSLIDENGVLSNSAENWDKLTIARLDEMKASVYQNATTELSRIASLSAAEATNELAKANGTLSQTAYMAAQAELEKVRVMGGAYAQLADNVWDATKNRVALIDAQLAAIGNKTYSPTVDFSKDSSKSKSSSNSEKELDFFEYRIKEYEEAIDSLETHLDNLTGSKAKNIVIDDIIKVQSLKHSDLQKAIDMYRSQADELFNKIPQEYREAAKNGALAVVDFVEASSDENDTIAETIEKYRDLTEKVDDYETEIEELNKTLRELQKQKFDNIVDDFEKLLDVISASTDKLNDLIDLQEKQYGTSSAKFYEELIAQEKERLRLLNEEKSALQSQMDFAIRSGAIKYGSDEWNEMTKSIQDVNSSIIESTGSLEEFQDAINELHWENFNEFIEQTQGVGDELNNLADLLSREDLFKTQKAGNASELAGIFNISKDSDELDFGATEWTDEGITAIGAYAQAMQTAQYNAEQFSEQLSQLDKDYANGKYSLEKYNEKHDELLDGQWQEIDNYNSAKDAMKDLYDNYIDAQINAIDKEVEAYSKLIEKQKDYYQRLLDENDAQKELLESKKSLTDLNAQILAMSGDTSDAGIAKRLKLEQQLSDTKQDYDNKVYKQNITNLQNSLDDKYERFSQNKEKQKTELEESKNDSEKIIKELTDFAIQNADIVLKTITTTSQNYGIKISDAVTKPWTNGETALARYDSTMASKSSSLRTQLETIKIKTYEVQTQADITASSLINTFGVSSAHLQGELTSVSNGLQTDIQKASGLYSQFGDLFSANGLDTSGLVGKINGIAGAVDGVSNSVITLGSYLDGLDGKEVDVSLKAPLVGQGYGSAEEELAKMLGIANYRIVDTDTNAIALDLGWTSGSSASSRLQELKNKNKNKKYRLEAYATGGTITEKDGIKISSLSNGDNRLVAVKPGEGILTPVQNEAWQNLSKIAPQLNTYFNDIVKIPNLPEIKRPTNTINYTGGDIIVQGNLDNVTMKQVENTVNKQINYAFDKFSRAALL